jgi:hypothetical protein
MEVGSPQEHLCSPRLRKAAGALAASGEIVVDRVSRIEKVVQSDKRSENSAEEALTRFKVL